MSYSCLSHSRSDTVEGTLNKDVSSPSNVSNLLLIASFPCTKIVLFDPYIQGAQESKKCKIPNNISKLASPMERGKEN